MNLNNGVNKLKDAEAELAYGGHADVAKLVDKAVVKLSAANELLKSKTEKKEEKGDTINDILLPGTQVTIRECETKGVIITLVPVDSERFKELCLLYHIAYNVKFMDTIPKPIQPFYEVQFVDGHCEIYEACRLKVLDYKKNDIL